MKKVLLITGIALTIVLLLPSCIAPSTSLTPITTSENTDQPYTQYVRNFIDGIQQGYARDPSKASIRIEPAMLDSLKVWNDTVIYMSSQPYYYSVASVGSSHFPLVTLDGYDISISESNPGVTYSGGGFSKLIKAEKDGKSVGAITYSGTVLNFIGSPAYIDSRTIENLTFLFMDYRTQENNSYTLWLVLLPVPGSEIPQIPSTSLTPSYSSLSITGTLDKRFLKTTVQEVEKMVNAKIPIPHVWPTGDSIREIYYLQERDTKPLITRILFLVSDLPVEWAGRDYRCQLAYEISWNEAGPGLEGPGETITEIGRNSSNLKNGKLLDNNVEYTLILESSGQPGSLGSTLKLYSSNQLPKDELFNIASSLDVGQYSDPGSAVFYPQWIPENAKTPLNETQKEGVLVQDSSGYIRLNNGQLLLIFPVSEYIEKRYGTVNVYNRDNAIIAKVGDQITISGGIVLREIAEQYFGYPLPENYLGTYFVVTDIISSPEIYK
jgi:hypothetical protein